VPARDHLHLVPGGAAARAPTSFPGTTGPAAGALALQRSIGNRATGAVLMRQTKTRRPGPPMVKLKVKPTQVMTGPEFSAFVLAQLEGISFEDAVERLPEIGWNYQTGRFLTGTTVADIDQWLEVRVDVPAESAGEKEDRGARSAEFKEVAGTERESINSEVDRRFWKRKGGKGKQLRLGADEQTDRELWIRTRDEVLRERDQVRGLPEEVKAHLFGEGGAALRPGQY
jgi:hypothetical protein